MHAVASFAKLGRDRSEAAPREKLQRYFENIDNSAERLTRLLNDLLDLAKIEAGKMSYTFEPQDLAAMLRSLVGEFEAMARERQVQLRLQCDLPPPLLRADALRLRQAFANLLSNAIRFSPPNTSVTIELAEARRPDGAAALVARVIDEGPGIAPEDLGVVFDRFVQSGGNRAGGTGLGLPITQEIVAAHGGAVTARNRPGGGAEFQLEIPLEGPPPAGSDRRAG